MEFQFTPDQEHAKKTIVDFLLAPVAVLENDLFITLSGFAGTGKTTIINAIITELKNKKKIVVSAPTHTAKEVIAGMTKQNAETIQALLGLRPDVEMDDFDPNKPVFNVKAEERIKNYDIVIIDECSMLNKSSVKLIKEKAIENKVKIVYMGDIFQLPPVGEKQSVVFNNPNIVTLTTIVRQSNENPNQKLIELARNDVRDGTDTCQKYLSDITLDVNQKGEGFKLLDQNTYYQEMLEHYFDSEYQHNPKVAKIICWTNNAVTATNRYIRNKVINSEEMVAVGDILMGYKSVSRDLPVYPYFVTYVKNSVDYIVTDVSLITKVVCDIELKGYKVDMEGADDTIFILHRDSYEDFSIEYQNRLGSAKMNGRYWKQFYEFKNQIILMEPFIDDYGRKLCDKDIDYGYAITVHKSQGSTYTNVGVTLKDLLKNRTPQERRQLIYVALSRTSKTNSVYAK